MNEGLLRQSGFGNNGRRFAAFIVALLAGACAAQLRAQNPEPISVIRAQHVRLPLASDIQRIAIGDGEILSAEPISNRELLLLGKAPGRTSMLIWYRNGTVHEYLVSVHRAFLCCSLP